MSQENHGEESRPRSREGLLSSVPGLRRLQDRIQGQIVNLTRADRAPNFLIPPGDPGFFGPDSVIWRVHADAPSMFVGGVSALLLQALHPLALAGVYDHSNFREDRLGRLRRTATFVAGTTYGSTQTAEELIQIVRRIHKTVVGEAPDGRPYSAEDPDLLTWVHTAEMASFLRAYQRYSGTPLPLEMQDRYFDETALLAQKLGARKIPRSVSEVERYFEQIQPEMVYSDQAREVLGAALDIKALPVTLRPSARLVFAAAYDLLPDFARRLFGYRTPALFRAALVRPAMRALGVPMRWALREGAVQNARRRMGLDPFLR